MSGYNFFSSKFIFIQSLRIQIHCFIQSLKLWIFYPKFEKNHQPFYLKFEISYIPSFIYSKAWHCIHYPKFEKTHQPFYLKFETTYILPFIYSKVWHCIYSYPSFYNWLCLSIYFHDGNWNNKLNTFPWNLLLPCKVVVKLGLWYGCPPISYIRMLSLSKSHLACCFRDKIVNVQCL